MATRAAALRREGRADAAVALVRSGLLIPKFTFLKALDLTPEDIQAAVLRRAGEPMPCELIGCRAQLYAAGQCRRHYLARWRRESDAPWARPHEGPRRR